MKFSLRELFLSITTMCVLCGLVDNVHRNYVFLGEFTGNYTRVETISYFIGLQGAIAGVLLCCLVYLLLKLGKARYRV